MARYNAATGLGKMYYAVIQSEDGKNVSTSNVKEVDYVQELKIRMGPSLCSSPYH